MFHLVLLTIGIVLYGCDGSNSYDYNTGYEAAWNEDNQPNIFSSKKYIDGYQQGLEDAAMYDDGFYDGYNKKKARYPKDQDYMDGFKDGNKNRKY